MSASEINLPGQSESGRAALLFDYHDLESKLRELRSAALHAISSLSQEYVSQCGNESIASMMSQYIATPPILGLDRMKIDQRIGEEENVLTNQKTGRTNHAFFIPVAQGAKWLEGVRDQKVVADGCPLAFLDEKRSWVEIRLTMSPDDEDGSLKRRLDYRTDLVRQYADEVTRKINSFNGDLAETVVAELEKRKSACLRAEQELASIGLPRVYNPGHAETAAQIQKFLQSLMQSMNGEIQKKSTVQSKVFIVHGHDDSAKSDVTRTLEKLGLDVIILHEQPNRGDTIIEKFIKNASSAEFGVIILTPDDEGYPIRNPDQRHPRARQNVILELGYFLGALGRDKLCVLYKGDLELPSDYHGIAYTLLDDRGAWKLELARELKSAGINVDVNRLTGSA